jgi:hypothetical protein
MEQERDLPAWISVRLSQCNAPAAVAEFPDPGTNRCRGWPSAADAPVGAERIRAVPGCCGQRPAAWLPGPAARAIPFCSRVLLARTILFCSRVLLWPAIRSVRGSCWHRPPLCYRVLLARIGHRSAWSRDQQDPGTELMAAGERCSEAQLMGADLETALIRTISRRIRGCAKRRVGRCGGLRFGRVSGIFGSYRIASGGT